MVHRERREWWGTPKTLTHRETESESERSQKWRHFSRAKGEKLVTPLFSQNPKIKTISFPQNQNPKLRCERSKRLEVPFSRNLRFFHTMATDSSDQLNFNPTTTTEENPKQTLQHYYYYYHAHQITLKKKKRKNNRWGFWLTFCNHRRFRREVW